MDYRLTVFLCLAAIMVSASAYPTEEALRQKRDVMDSMKDMWNEVVKTLTDAGDAVVQVFQPTTEKNVIVRVVNEADKSLSEIGGSIIHVFKPTEKSMLDKMADGIKNLGQ